MIMMMGASAEEVKEVSRPMKEERVLGFNEEEKRQFLRRQRVSKTRLPDGPYTFRSYKTLELPFVKVRLTTFHYCSALSSITSQSSIFCDTHTFDVLHCFR